MRIEEEIKQSKFRDNFQKALINIIYTSNYLTREHNLILKPYNITQQQYNILRILRGHHPKPASVNTLIDRMLDKMSNASRLVEKLRQKDLVKRELSPTDRRQVDVVITDKGLKLLMELDSETDQFAKLSNKLTSKEAQQLSDLLDKIRN